MRRKRWATVDFAAANLVTRESSHLEVGNKRAARGERDHQG